MLCCVFSIPRVSTPFPFVFTQLSHGRQEGSCLPSEAESVGSWVAGYHPGEGQCNSGPVFLLHPSFPATPHSIPCITLFSWSSRFRNVICVASIMNRTVRNYLQNWTNFNTYMYQVRYSALSKYPDINGEESPTAQAALCASSVCPWQSIDFSADDSFLGLTYGLLCTSSSFLLIFLFPYFGSVELRRIITLCSDGICISV